MKQDNEKIVAALNRLVETCKDGQTGFRDAGQRVKNPELQQLLTGYAAQWAAFAAELQEEVRRYGGDPAKGGTMLGSLQRGWHSIEAAVLGESEAGILEACAKGEESALQSYEATAHEVLPPDVQAIVARQHRDLRLARERLHDLLHGVTA